LAQHLQYTFAKEIFSFTWLRSGKRLFPAEDRRPETQVFRLAHTASRLHRPDGQGADFHAEIRKGAHPMSVTSISQYTYGLSLADFLNGSDKTAENSSSGSLGSSSSLAAASKKIYETYGAGTQSASGMAAIRQALEEIEPDSSGRITFKMISEHRARLEEDFTALVKAGLLLDGVDEQVEFKLVATAEGDMQIQCADPEQQAKIEQFFKNVPELEEEFLYIQALGNMEKARASATASTHRLNAQAAKTGLQSQAMEIFFQDIFSSGLGYSSLLADFDSGGNADYLVGANYFV
jgi:hypothetical protein